jgi:hypothetical protein
LRTEAFGVYGIRIEALCKQCVRDNLCHRIRAADPGLVNGVAAAEALVQLLYFGRIEATAGDIELLLFLAEDKMNLKTLWILVLERKQIFDKHGRILPAVAIEQRESTGRGCRRTTRIDWSAHCVIRTQRSRESA